jgi:TRAP-type C4-dicarboxylate transport system permease small subunit
MRVIASGLAGLARMMRVLTGGLLVISVLLNFANIFGRYFLNAPLQWGEEVMLFLMVGIVFSGAVVISAQGRHIRMDIVVALLPAPAQRFFGALTILAEGIAAAVVVWIGVPVVMELADFDQRADASNVPLYIPQAVVPLGMGLIALICLARLVLLLGGRRTTAVLPTAAVAEPAPLVGA